MLDQPMREDVPPLPPPDLGVEPRVRTRVPIPVRPGQDVAWFNAEVATFEGLRDRKEHLALPFRAGRTFTSPKSCRPDCSPTTRTAVT